MILGSLIIVEILKRKLIHGGEGTVLIGGLTLVAGKALSIAGATVKGVKHNDKAPTNDFMSWNKHNAS